MRTTATLLSLFTLVACDEAAPDITATTAEVQAGRLPQTTQIRVRSNGLCLTALANRRVEQQPCSGRLDQRWRVTPVIGRPGHFTFQANDGRCLDLPGGSTTAGTDLQTYRCHNGPNQHFLVRQAGADHEILSAARQCLDIEWGDAVAGRAAQQYTCHGGANQRFSLETTPTLLATMTETCAAPAMTWESPAPRRAYFHRGQTLWGETSGFYRFVCAGLGRGGRCPAGTGSIEVHRPAQGDQLTVDCYADNDALVAPVSLADRRLTCDAAEGFRVWGSAGAVDIGIRQATPVPLSGDRLPWRCGTQRFRLGEVRCPGGANEVEITRWGDNVAVECRAN